MTLTIYLIRKTNFASFAFWLVRISVSIMLSIFSTFFQWLYFVSEHMSTMNKTIVSNIKILYLIANWLLISCSFLKQLLNLLGLDFGWIKVLTAQYFIFNLFQQYIWKTVDILYILAYFLDLAGVDLPIIELLLYCGYFRPMKLLYRIKSISKIT